MEIAYPNSSSNSICNSVVFRNGKPTGRTDHYAITEPSTQYYVRRIVTLLN